MLRLFNCHELVLMMEKPADAFMLPPCCKYLNFAKGLRVVPRKVKRIFRSRGNLKSSLLKSAMKTEIFTGRVSRGLVPALCLADHRYAEARRELLIQDRVGIMIQESVDCMNIRKDILLCLSGINMLVEGHRGWIFSSPGQSCSKGLSFLSTNQRHCCCLLNHRQVDRPAQESRLLIEGLLWYTEP